MERLVWKIIWVWCSRWILSSASAQVFADIALCPFEAVKVRVQTQPNFAKGLSDGFPKLYAREGISGYILLTTYG